MVKFKIVRDEFKEIKQFAGDCLKKNEGIRAISQILNNAQCIGLLRASIRLENQLDFLNHKP